MGNTFTTRRSKEKTESKIRGKIYTKTYTRQAYNQDSSTHQYNQELQYWSNHLENVNKTTTSCGNSTSNSTDYATHHRNSNYICHQYSNNLVYDNYAQTNVSTTMTTLPCWSTWMTYY
eukprot:2265428-Amphidinium_carterae.1